MQFRELRKKYPKFIYEKYSWRTSKRNLNISFSFKIKPDIDFKPRVIIKNVPLSKIKSFNKNVLDNLIFHLGLIELFSYWKATSSSKIKIEAGPLSKEQIKWWKNLIIDGMGQFFYENNINFRDSSFLKIITEKNNKTESYPGRLKNRVLVPIGGGKDSVVTLEILKKAKKRINCFALKPIPASKKTMELGDCKKPIIVSREIDKKLLELNQKGFLNGHTPFSAYLAFLSVLLGVIFDYKYAAFSNERSSNEGNVKYLDKVINHQYSKTFDFEEKFRSYSKKYLVKEVEYFSFLRPLYEIQISKLFSRFPKYFALFLSCNQAYKTYSGRKSPLGGWCCKCPKCLFIFASLYPFLETKKLIKIFGKNLFEEKELLPLMLRLIGEKDFKPFECVGTKKESQIAFYLGWKKARGRASSKLPYLLDYFENKVLPRYPNLEKDSKKIMNSWDKKHNLPKELKKILKGTLLTNFNNML
jgi:hypothetical protein